MKRNDAYAALGETFNMTVKIVISKIKKLRSYFSREQLKMMVIKIGSVGDANYETSWFAPLLFIGDMLTSRSTKDSLQAEITNSSKITDDNLTLTSQKPETEQPWTEFPTEPPEVVSRPRGGMERFGRYTRTLNENLNENWRQLGRRSGHSLLVPPYYDTNRKFRHLLLTHNLNMARSMLESDKAVVNHIDRARRSPLHLAVTLNFEATQLLLDFGANPNAKNKIGRTPLHLAAICENADLVELLLENGANIAEKDSDGNTPLQLANSKLKALSNATNPNSELLLKIIKVIDMLHIHMAKEEAKLEKLSELFPTSLKLSDS